MNVGVKALKNSLSRYLRAVRAGETVLVTERGAVVAELRPRAPRSGTAEDAALDTLERQGILSRGQGQASADAPVRLTKGVKASDLVVTGRDD